MSQVYDLVVIGSGPGGYVGAIRAAQLGLKTALVEKAAHLGGTCLNVGCIPTKALLESAKTWDKLQHLAELGFKSTGDLSFDWAKIQARKDGIVDSQRKGLRFLMKKNKIDVFEGHGRLAAKGKVSVTAADGKVTTLDTKKVLLAMGSRVRQLPIAKSNGKTIMTSDDLLFIDEIPGSLAVIGGGVIGIEFASLFARMGTAVTVIEMAPQILPSEDDETVAELMKHLKKQGVSVETSTKLTSVEDKKDGPWVTTEGAKPRRFDRVLISIGREPVTNDCGLEQAGVRTERGYVIVDDKYRTSADWVWAIGDLLTTPALAHTASAEGICAAEIIAGHKSHPINYSANPNAIYCYPEIASMGLTEKSCKEKKIEYKTSKFPFAPLAKAKIENATEGFIKIIFEPKYREILGVHIVGARASELIAEFSLGKVLETTVDEIAQTIHPHPTISETVMEAAHAALGPAIHM